MASAALKRTSLTHDVTENVHGTVRFVGTRWGDQLVCQEEILGGAGAAFHYREIGCVAFDGKDHVAGGEAHGGVRVGGTIV